MISALQSAIASEDSEAIQDAVYELGKCRNTEGLIDDEVAFEVLAILRSSEVWNSTFGGHLLNFFEFEAPRLSQRAKDRCEAFLREWGNQFTDVHSVQVVGELLYGTYLKPVPPKPPRKKPRHAKK
jgi:hypothetical protein